MPRIAIASQSPKGPYVALPVTANSLDLTFTAADVANKNSTVFAGSRMLVVVKNDNAGAQTFTISSVADTHQRTGDVGPYSLAAGEVGLYLVERDGFIQADGALYFEGSHADVKFAVVAL